MEVAEPILRSMRLVAELRQQWRASVADVTAAMDELEGAVGDAALGGRADVVMPMELVMQRLYAHVALIHEWTGGEGT